MQGLDTPATINPTSSPSADLTEESNAATSPTEMFVSSSSLRRQSMEQQKQAELEAIRKKGIAQTTKNSPYFAAATTTTTTTQDSLSNSRRSSYQDQTRAMELESLSNTNNTKNLSQSWRGPSTTTTNADETAPATAIPKNRSIKATFITTTTVTPPPSLASSTHGSAHNSELEELRKKGLTKAASLQHVPPLVREQKRALHCELRDILVFWKTHLSCGHLPPCFIAAGIFPCG
jgi:hypothetical protein